MLRRRARRRGQQRHLGAAHRLPGARRRARATASGPRPITFVASANCARYCGAERRLRRHRSAHLQHERRARSRRSSQRPQRDGTLPKVVDPGALRRPAAATWRRSARWPSATASGSSRMPRMRSARRYRGEPVGSCRYSRHHRVQLSPGQDHHHRRRRHGADQRRRAGAAHARCCAPTASRATPTQMTQPADGAVVLRADRARLQLPDDRHPGGARPEPA